MEAKRPKRREAAMPAAFVEDWAFHLPMPAFLSALDIRRDEMRSRDKGPDGKPVVTYVWTQSVPPKCSFVTGYMFYKPQPPGAAWGEQVKQLQHAIQVQSTSGDKLAIEVLCYLSRRKFSATLSHDDMVELLRTGAMKGIIGEGKLAP